MGHQVQGPKCIKDTLWATLLGVGSCEIQSDNARIYSPRNYSQVQSHVSQGLYGRSVSNTNKFKILDSEPNSECHASTKGPLRDSLT